jgi:hypothetical protein
MHELLAGATAMCLLMAGAWFLQTWSTSRDRLFLLFAIAFLLMAGTQVYQAIAVAYREPGTLQYIVRLVSYLLILAAIIDRNRARPDPSPTVP